MVQEIEVEKLVAAPYNPRINLEPGMPEWERLENSIKEFGYVEPVIWNKRTGHVVGGHQRLAVLKSLGWKKVPCSIVDMSEEDEKVLNVALNKINGEWDYDKLSEVLDEFDYDMKTLSGFSPEEIAILSEHDEDFLDGDDTFADWDDEEGIYVGGSYCVSLVFENTEYAKGWAKEEGFDGKIKDGTKTTVVRIE